MSSKIDAAAIAELRAQLSAGTARPWTPLCPPWGDGTFIVSDGPLHGRPEICACNPFGRRDNAALDASLICAAINALPELLGEIEHLRGDVVRLQYQLVAALQEAAP